MAFLQLVFTTFAGYHLIAYAVIKLSWTFGGFHYYVPEVAHLHATAGLDFHVASTVSVAALGVLLLLGFKVYLACSLGIFMICFEQVMFHNSPHEPLQVGLVAGLISLLVASMALTALCEQLEGHEDAEVFD